MSDVKHTPEPWGVRQIGSQTFVDACDFQVALMCDGTPKQIKANARLIAAAPDLLEALKQIAKIGREDFGPAAASRMDEIARAAIAKAEGRL